MPSPANYRARITLFLRDKDPKSNLLLNAQQFTLEEVENALQLSADAYNVMPPVTSLTWNELPPFLAILGAARFLMFSESFIQLRNQASIPVDSGEAMGIDDKHAMYAQLQDRLRAEFDEAARNYKDQKNLESFYGSLSSEFSYTGRY